MNITIHIAHWYLPAAITFFGFLVVVLLGWAENRTAGDYCIPVFTMGAFVAWVAASLAAWSVFLFLK